VYSGSFRAGHQPLRNLLSGAYFIEGLFCRFPTTARAVKRAISPATIDSTGNPGIGIEGVIVTVPVTVDVCEKVVKYDVVVPESVEVDVTSVEIVDVATVLVDVTDCVVVLVAVAVAEDVVTVVTGMYIWPKRRITLLGGAPGVPPTAHPSTLPTIHTALRSRLSTLGTGDTRAQVTPFQKSMNGIPEPSWTPTAQPSEAETM